jgi:hypothetical protein
MIVLTLKSVLDKSEISLHCWLRGLYDHHPNKAAWLARSRRKDIGRNSCEEYSHTYTGDRKFYKTV